MKRISILLIVSLLLIAVASMAYAQDIKRQGPCKADIEKFCKNIKPGQGRLAKCIKAHEKDLSPACKNRTETDREKLPAFIKACKPDTDALCRGIKPGDGRLIKCLKENKSLLSIPCKAYLQKK